MAKNPTSKTWTEPAVFVPEVTKQHDVFAGAIALVVHVSVRANFWLDKKIPKLFECFHEDLPKPTLVPPTDLFSICQSFFFS